MLKGNFLKFGLQSQSRKLFQINISFDPKLNILFQLYAFYKTKMEGNWDKKSLWIKKNHIYKMFHFASVKRKSIFLGNQHKVTKYFGASESIFVTNNNPAE